MVDQTAVSNGEVAKASAKFPSLQEQKLADLAFKRLGLELEPINDADLNRVKALGYEGGVSVASGAAGLGGERNMIRAGDILVGLGIWPTSSMKAVGEILTRPEIADLNPVKFYVVRGETLSASAGAMPQQPDAVPAGRVEIRNDGLTEAGFSTATPAPDVLGVAPRFPAGSPYAITTQAPAQGPQSQPVIVGDEANPYASPPTATALSSIATNVAEVSKRLEDALNRKTEAMEKRTAAKTDDEVEKAKRDLDAANKQLEEAKRRLEEVRRQPSEATSLVPRSEPAPASDSVTPTTTTDTANRPLISSYPAYNPPPLVALPEEKTQPPLPR